MTNKDGFIDLEDEVEMKAKVRNPAILIDGADNPARKRLKSGVWAHFIIPNPVPKDDPRTWCKHCNDDYAFGPSTIGTSSLRTHLTKCKVYNFKKPDPRQTTLFCRKNASGGASLESIAYNKDLCRKALARMIIVDELPFRFVEKDGFQHFCSVMQPKFELPTRVTIAREIMSLYGKEKEKLKLLFKNSSQQVCLTTDTWTSIQNVNYMVLTAHYIDDDWNLQKRIINFETISNHKGETIGKMIEACLIAWGIERVLTITMDNASSNDVAVSYMKRKICNWGKAILSCEFLHMRCCAHILNLVVTSGLKDYDRSIKVIRNAVRYVRSSPSRLAKFRQCVEDEKINVSGSVCLDVPTRWNSTFLMLDSAIKYRKAFERMEDDSQYFGYFIEELGLEKEDANRIGPPSSQDWEAAENFMLFLELFFVVTKRFSGSLYVTSNMYFHDLCSLYTHITCCIEDDNVKLSHMACDMKLKFDKYWGDVNKINPLLFVAVVLDPRYKQQYVEWSFVEMYGENDVSSKMNSRVKDSLKKVFDHYCAKDPDNAKKESCSQTTKNVRKNSDDKRRNIHDRHLSKYKSFVKAGDESEQSELDKYLNDARECMDGDFDLLGWWKMNANKYKILSQVAKDVLAIPVSTVSSESAFSTGGRVLGSYRSSLTPKTVQALICAQNWLRNEVSQEEIDIPATLQEIEDLEDVEHDFAALLNLSTDHIE